MQGKMDLICASRLPPVLHVLYVGCRENEEGFINEFFFENRFKKKKNKLNHLTAHWVTVNVAQTGVTVSYSIS